MDTTNREEALGSPSSAGAELSFENGRRMLTEINPLRARPAVRLSRKTVDEVRRSTLHGGAPAGNMSLRSTTAGVSRGVES